LRANAYERFRRGRRRDRAAANAIGRYIFPGGELDHLGMSVTGLELNGFEVHDVEAWREHYARTTRFWHDRLRANYEAAEREVGRDKARLWIAYLAVVSIAFTQGTIGIFQTLASRRVRGPSDLPPTRADLYR
jgi:cyclopropane-fatty-acyl-phospholipid synthase